MYFPEFLIQELQEIIPNDIHRLYDTSNKNRTDYNKYRELKYWKFNDKYSYKYCNEKEFYIKDEMKKKYSIIETITSLLGYKEIPTGKTFYEYINSKIDTQNKLSLKIRGKTTIKENNKIIENINKLGKVHTLVITDCETNIWNDTGTGFNKERTNTWDVSDLGNLHSLCLSRWNESKRFAGLYRYHKLLLIGIKNLGNLHTLDLSYTEVSAEDVIHLGKVHTLNISNNYSIHNTCIKHLGNVHTLNVSHCVNITDEGIKHLGNVHTLNVSHCVNITDEGIKYLGNCHTLDLSFGNNNITDISCLNNVHTLNLRWDEYYTTFIPRGLKQLKNICLLNLKGNRNITDELLKEFVNVHTLNVSGCNITNNGIKHLGNIHSLDISTCENITVEGIKYLEKLHTLNLSRCKKIMNEDLKYLSNCHTLDLSYCEKISDKGLKYLTMCHTLILYGCNDITDAGLKNLVNAKKIYLDISFPKNISKSCIINLGNVYISKGQSINYETIWVRFKE